MSFVITLSLRRKVTRCVSGPMAKSPSSNGKECFSHMPGSEDPQR